MPAHPSESPAKKQSKWSAEEDALIIDLRGSGMKWEDISKRLPGRSAISCRLHYQNYLERRSEWDEERKNKLARLYERFKPEMWSKVAEEMAVPWRAAEAMHWQLGEAEMARRAGVVPFSLSNVSLEAPPGHPHSRNSPSRGHAHSQSHPAVFPMSTSGPAIAAAAAAMTPTTRFLPRSVPPLQQHLNAPIHSSRALAARRDSLGPSQRPVSMLSPSEQPVGLPGIRSPTVGGLGLGRGAQTSGALLPMLPSVAEMTTGMSPYSGPSYSVSSSPGGMYASPAPTFPSMGYSGPHQPQLPTTRPMTAGPSMDSKRRRSPEFTGREATRRRQDL